MRECKRREHNALLFRERPKTPNNNHIGEHVRNRRSKPSPHVGHAHMIGMREQSNKWISEEEVVLILFDRWSGDEAG